MLLVKLVKNKFDVILLILYLLKIRNEFNFCCVFCFGLDFILWERLLIMGYIILLICVLLLGILIVNMVLIKDKVYVKFSVCLLNKLINR